MPALAAGGGPEVADTLSWRNFVVGTLLSLIVFLSSQGATPPRATTALPGLEGVAGSTLFPGFAEGAGSTTNAPRVDSASEPADRPFVAVPALRRVTPAQTARKSEGQQSDQGAPEPVTQPAGQAAPKPDQQSGEQPERQSGGHAAPQAAERPAPQPAKRSTAPSTRQPAPAPAAPAAGGTPGEIAGAFNYTITPGDDLSTLSARFSTTPAAIAEASGIPVAQGLYDGMTVRIPTTDPAKVEPVQGAVAIPWSTVDGMWGVGTVAQVTDVETGNIFYVMRQGGWAHADVEPVSARDTAIILSDYGGEYSWARRSIVVVVNGRRIAASQNFMPHGLKSLDNNFPGHFCIHFLGSTTHGSSYTSNGVPTLDPAHQRCVQEAVGH